MEKRVSNSPNQQLALTNCIFLNSAEHEALSSDGDDVYVEVRAAATYRDASRVPQRMRSTRALSAVRIRAASRVHLHGARLRRRRARLRRLQLDPAPPPPDHQWRVCAHDAAHAAAGGRGRSLARADRGGLRRCEEGPGCRARRGRRSRAGRPPPPLPKHTDTAACPPPAPAPRRLSCSCDARRRSSRDSGSSTLASSRRSLSTGAATIFTCERRPSRRSAPTRR